MGMAAVSGVVVDSADVSILVDFREEFNRADIAEKDFRLHVELNIVFCHVGFELVAVGGVESADVAEVQDDVVLLEGVLAEH